LKGKDLYLVDFCYDEPVLKKLVKNNKKVVVIDHHVSKKDVLKYATESVYGTNHSGSVLTWKYFNPSKPIPALLRYVEDNDLWKFKMKGAKSIMLAVDQFPYEFKKWDWIAKEIEIPKKRRVYYDKGEAILNYVKGMVKEIADIADLVKFEGYKVLAVNAPRFLRSDLGNKLVERKYPFGITWYIKGKEVHVSLRSDGTVDVSKICEKYGGGGHKKAAGFTFMIKSKNEFPWKIIDIK